MSERERSAQGPTGATDQQAQISGNLFHNIAASCSPRLARTEGGGRDLGGGQTFPWLLILATCAEPDSPLILLEVYSLPA